MAPSKKRSAAQVEIFRRVQSSSPAIVPDFEGALAQCQNELAGAMSELLKLQDSSKETIRDLKSQVHAAKQHQQDTYQELRNDWQVHQHVAKCKATLDEEIAKLKGSQVEEIKKFEKKSVTSSQRFSSIVTTNQHLQNELSTTMSQFARSELSGSKAENYSLKHKAAHAAQSRAKKPGKK